MLTAWEDYLSPSGGEEAYRTCHRGSGPAFRRQREIIRRVFEASRPGVVACLGAGVLNDIPYRALVSAGIDLHLVDWLPGVVDSGIAHSIITRETGADPACVYCALGADQARAHCRAFHRTQQGRFQVCERFEPAPDDEPRCAAFERGERPAVHQADVTGGFASAFGRGVIAELRDTGSWRQAIGKAKNLARRAKGHEARLDIADASVDLVISSMLLSQFEHEPYEYFERQVASLIGPARASEEQRLRGAIDALRDALVTHQVERHCDEIERIMVDGGRCFMSFELFHFAPERGHWFMVKEMYGALAILARRFRFDFDLLDPADAVARFEGQNGPSMVHCFMLEKQPA